jgi:hypothetical protein
MRTDDIKKLSKAGFMVYRTQDYPQPMIVYWKKGCWVVSSTHSTIQERDKAMEELHKSYAVILD